LEAASANRDAISQISSRESAHDILMGQFLFFASSPLILNFSKKWMTVIAAESFSTKKDT
jgi:hypothetical protein